MPFATVCPRSSAPFYIVSYYIKCVTTSWTYSCNFLNKTGHYFLDIQYVQILIQFCFSSDPFYIVTYSIKWVTNFWTHSNSEIVAHVNRNICLRHLIRSRAVTNRIFFSEKTYLPFCVRNIFLDTS